jgi:hypothetical protein
MDKTKSKWDFLIQCRPNVKGMIGNGKFIGGYIDYDDNHDEIFNFITTKGTFSSNRNHQENKNMMTSKIR